MNVESATPVHPAAKPLVCIGFSEALSAPEVAWSLLAAGCEVVGFARRGRRSALRHSSQVKVHEITPPEKDSTAALADLQQLLKTLPSSAGRRVLLFPLDDTAVWLCNQVPPAPGWSLVGPSGANTHLALSKTIQVRAAEAAGLHVPTTTITRVPAEVMAFRPNLPLVLRPSDAVLFENGRLKKGRNWICATEAELQQAVDAWAGSCPLMVQPFIDGVGEGVFGLATAEGVIGWSAHRRLRMMNPHGSGSSACISQPVPEEVKVPIERLIKQTGWRGLFMVELLQDRSGNHWFVELNGRPWGSMALARRQGMEYPAWAVHQILHPGQPVGVPEPSTTPLVCRNAGREIMHLFFVLRGPKSTALKKKWPSVWQTLFELLRVRRGDSLYNWQRGDLKVFFRDTWYTLRSNLRKSND